MRRSTNYQTLALLAYWALGLRGGIGFAQPIPVYGSPGYTPGAGGYIVGVGEIDGINNSIAVNNHGVAVARAHRYNAAVPLDGLPAGPGGFARDINDDGVAVGSVLKVPNFPGDNFGLRAARWNASGTAIIMLGTLGFAPNGEARVEAFAINAAGLIVGAASAHNSATELPNPRAVLWRAPGTAIDLNSLIDPTSGWLLTHAYAVSDSGWIAGDGYFDPDGPGSQEAYGRHFLLQVPEPSTTLPLFEVIVAGLSFPAARTRSAASRSLRRRAGDYRKS